MAELHWDQELAVGVKEIDDQHKELIRICNMLIQAAAKEKSRNEVEAIVKQLREYTVLHFRSEEAFMATIHYPKRGEQVQAHAELKRDVQEFQRRLYEREDVSAREVLDFMKGWLLNHILTHDRELARFVAETSKKAKPVTIGGK